MMITKIMCKTIANYSTLSTSDISQIQNLLLDFFAAMYAGYKQNKQFADEVEAVVLAQGGVAESTVLFNDVKLPARTAAFLNSLYGHGAELDDGNKKAMGHVGVHIIPAVLSLAEAENKSMNEVMIAIACGYEAYIRISSAAQPGMVNRSFHSTGFAGAPACAIACAKLLGLDAEGIESAMSFACTMASGLLTYSESQQMIKPINPAKAAETGIFAARLAQRGIKGPENCLEGPHGWFKAAAEVVDESIITKHFDHLLIHDCYFKLFPSCRHTHCGIESAINIYNLIKDDNRSIKNVDVFIYPNAIKLAGQIKHPVNADETKFSIHYTLACALLFGEYGVDYMDPPRNDEEIYALIERIHLISDEKMEIREKGIRGTRVEVTMSNGELIPNTVLVPKGDPEKPLAREDIIFKLKTCANGIVSEEHLNKIIEHLSSFGGDSPINYRILFGKD